MDHIWNVKSREASKSGPRAHGPTGPGPDGPTGPRAQSPAGPEPCGRAWAHGPTDPTGPGPGSCPFLVRAREPVGLCGPVGPCGPVWARVGRCGLRQIQVHIHVLLQIRIKGSLDEKLPSCELLKMLKNHFSKVTDE